MLIVAGHVCRTLDNRLRKDDIALRENQASTIDVHMGPDNFAYVWIGIVVRASYSPLVHLCNLKYLLISCDWLQIIVHGCCLDVLLCSVSNFCRLQRLHVYDGFWFSGVPEWIIFANSIASMI